MVFRLFDRNAERFQKVKILRGESIAPCRTVIARQFEPGRGLLFQLIQTYRCLQHQQNVESLLANIFHHASDVLRLRNALMYGFAQLLDKVPQFLVQGFTPFPRRVVRGRFLRGFSYITSDASRWQSESISAATLLYMEPKHVGRKLGIGVRVASGMVRDRAAQAAHSMQQEAPAVQQQTAVYAQLGAERRRAVATGAKKFGQSVWGPFVHAGGVLWLEVTGLFFALFGLFFAQNAYKLRHAWYSGANHSRFLIYAVVTLVFFYFTFSSFYRARKKEKLKRQRS